MRIYVHMYVFDCEVIVAIIALVQPSGSLRELLDKISLGRGLGGVVHMPTHACLYIYVHIYNINYVCSCGCACGYILMADKMLVPGF